MKQATIPHEVQEMFGCRPMTQSEALRLGIKTSNDFEYYVCSDWLKFLLNRITLEEFELEMEYKIDIDFTKKVAYKQQQSVQKHLKTKRFENQDFGQRPDIRATIGSGLQRARYIRFQRQEVLKRVVARNVNFATSWHYANKHEEKVYALLETQEPNTKVFINYILLAERATFTKRNIAVWFDTLSFDMFKIGKEHFYPIISHNLTLSSIYFANDNIREKNGRKTMASAVWCHNGIDSLQNILINR